MTDDDVANLTKDDRPMPDALTRALDELEALVSRARGVPMSSSVMVSRSEFADRVRAARAALPKELASARVVLADRAQVLERARREAKDLVDEAERRRAQVLDRASIVKAAREEAARIIEGATERAEAIRLEAEDYVERRLANFEVVLSKTLAAVERGRLKLRGRLREADWGDLAQPWSEIDSRTDDLDPADARMLDEAGEAQEDRV